MWESFDTTHGLTYYSLQIYLILECCEGKIVSIHEGSGSGSGFEISSVKGNLFKLFIDKPRD